MPAKNSAGPKPHLTHCRAMRAQGTPASARIRVALWRSSAPKAPCVATTAPRTPPSRTKQIAAQADPQQRHFRRQLADEGGEIHDVARREEEIGRAAGVPGGVLGHGHVVQHAGAEFRRQFQRVLRAHAARSRREAALQILGHCAQIAGAHGQHHIAVVQHGAQRIGQIIDALDEHRLDDAAAAHRAADGAAVGARRSALRPRHRLR